MQARLLDKSEIDDVWPRIEGQVKRLDCAQIRAEHIKKYLSDGSYFAMIAENRGEIVGVLLFYFIEYPTQWACRIMGLAGIGIDEWGDYLGDFEKMVKKYGCSSIEFQGRKGWERFLKNKGYNLEAVVIRKEL